MSKCSLCDFEYKPFVVKKANRYTVTRSRIPVMGISCCEKVIPFRIDCTPSRMIAREFLYTRNAVFRYDKAIWDFREAFVFSLLSIFPKVECPQWCAINS